MSIIFSIQSKTFELIFDEDMPKKLPKWMLNGESKMNFEREQKFWK